MILPGFIVGLVCLMPFLGKWRLGHRFNVGLLFTLLAGGSMLTWLAVAADRKNPDYVASVRQATLDAERVKELAASPSGIPSSGAVALLRADPLTQGPKLFAKNCASCHRYDGHDGLGNTPKDPQTAADLKGFASRPWLSGLLAPEKVATAHYFGGTKFKDGKMARFVKKDVAGFSTEQKEQLRKIIAAVSAEASLKSQKALDQQDASVVGEGRTLFANETMRCSECHQFHKKDEDASAPDLTGYGSRDWLLGIIANPKHERFYGKRSDRMPAFGTDKILDAQAMGLLADWLRGEWYEPPHQARTAAPGQGAQAAP
jgi:ubiquinol-cytochrome c reductase cytochrome b subunit